MFFLFFWWLSPLASGLAFFLSLYGSLALSALGALGAGYMGSASHQGTRKPASHQVQDGEGWGWGGGGWWVGQPPGLGVGPDPGGINFTLTHHSHSTTPTIH